MSLAGSNILVIGANGALGSQIAKLLMQRGAQVIGTARSNETAATLPAGMMQALLLDLESEQSIDTLVSYLSTQDQPLDGVVVASGLVAFGSVAETPSTVSSRLMKVNHLAPARVISGLAQKLATSTKEPFVASISGVVAEKVFPGMAAYVTSKTAHSTWLKAFALEARRAGIRVVDARPGHTETGLAGRAVFGTTPAFPQGMTAEHVATVIVDGIDGGLKDLASEAF
jgi:cyclic-di-GMP-binding biofilm dispersal mediator protein